MSLTINTEPAHFCNSAIFNVTTDLTEGASYQNLRIKAELYHKGEVVAVKTQRKGLDDFDFTEILKSFCKPHREDVDEATHVLGPSGGANLITGWTNAGLETFSVTGNVLNNIVNDGGVGYCYSNDISVTKGKYYSFRIAGETHSGSGKPWLIFGTSSSVLVINRVQMADGTQIYVFQATSTGTLRIYISSNGVNVFGIATGTCTLHQVTTVGVDFQSVPFGVIFTEMYENASDVTTSGDIAYSWQHLFFNLVGTITNFICDGPSKKFLIEDPGNLMKYQNDKLSGWGARQISFITKRSYVKIEYTIDGGGASDDTFTNVMGYGVIIINDQVELWEHLAHQTITLQMKYGGSAYSVLYTMNRITKCLDTANHIRLEWTNHLGALMSHTLMGGSSEVMAVEKSIYRNADNKRRLASSIPTTKKILISEPESTAFARLIAEVLESKTVYRLEETSRVEVFVSSHQIRTYRNTEYIIFEIQIEE